MKWIFFLKFIVDPATDSKIKFESKYKGTPTQIFYFDVLILLLFQDWEGVLSLDWSFSDRKSQLSKHAVSYFIGK